MYKKIKFQCPHCDKDIFFDVLGKMNKSEVSKIIEARTKGLRGEIEKLRAKLKSQNNK